VGSNHRPYSYQMSHLICLNQKGDVGFNLCGGFGWGHISRLLMWVDLCPVSSCLLFVSVSFFGFGAQFLRVDNTYFSIK